MKKGFFLIVIGFVLVFYCSQHMESDNTVSNSSIDDSEIENVEVVANIDTPKEDNNEKEIYSPDRYANEIIIQFNEQNPDRPVTHEMVKTWTTGGGEATLVSFEDYCMQFGHVDGYATFLIFSDREKEKRNKDTFIDESVKWAKAIFSGTFFDVKKIIKEASESGSIVETELEYYYKKYNMCYKEDGKDSYQKDHTYMMEIYPSLW